MPQGVSHLSRTFRFGVGYPKHSGVSAAIQSLGRLLILPAIASISAAITGDGGERLIPAREPNANTSGDSCCAAPAAFDKPSEKDESGPSADIPAG